MIRESFSKKLNSVRVAIENSIADTADLVCTAVDTMVRFFSDVFWALKTIGGLTLLAFFLLALVMSGCATGYYAHVWCKSSTKNVSFGVYTQDDGKLMVKVYDADGGCSYVKDQNVVIQDENKTVK